MWRHVFNVPIVGFFPSPFSTCHCRHVENVRHSSRSTFSIPSAYHKESCLLVLALLPVGTASVILIPSGMKRIRPDALVRRRCLAPWLA
jgi:hypothetical protein